MVSVPSMSKLASTKDAQVKEILDELTAIDKHRTDALGTVDTTKLADFTDEVKLKVWPIYMKQAANTVINQLHTSALEAINTPKVAAVPDTDISSVLAEIVDLAAFETLFTRISNFANTSSQNSAREDLIVDVSKLIPNSTEVFEAMEGVGNTDNKNLIIGKIIKELKDSKPCDIKKQQLTQTLREELINIIAIDEKLVSVVAELLCPHLIFSEKYLPDPSKDAFYQSAFEEASLKRDTLLAESSNTRSETLRAIRDEFEASFNIDGKLSSYLNKQDISGLNAWLLSVTSAGVNPSFLS